MEKVKGVFSHVIAIHRTSAARLRPRLSFPALTLCKHERQNDVIQHLHPCRFDLESRLPLLHQVASPVELSDYCFLSIGCNQLHTVVERSAPRTLAERRACLRISHPHCPHSPSILDAVWSGKHVAPGVRNR